METIAVFNTRGGSGKSAATVFLADFLTSAFKKRVLVVDLDPQRSSSVALLGEERVDAELESGKCLAALLQRVGAGESLEASDVRDILMERPQTEGRGRTTYLGPVHVMASSRANWKELDARLSVLAGCAEPNANRVLLDTLEPLKPDFDICLIDFPAHETGPITKNGLRAAGWWVFPCIPDRSGSRDIEGPVEAYYEACRGTRHRLQPLGTLLSICQDAKTREYKQARQALHQAAEQKYIPSLLEKKMLFWPAAREALDDTRWNGRTTLKKKYANTPLYNAGRGLAKEVLSRLDMPGEDMTINKGILGKLNLYVRKAFVGAEVK